MTAGSLSRDDRMVAGAAILLVVALLFFPWFSVTTPVLTGAALAFCRSVASNNCSGATHTSSAVGPPHGWLGTVAVLALLALLAQLAVQRFSPATRIPNIGGSATRTRSVLAIAAGAAIALKFLLNIDFSSLGFGFYAVVVFEACLLYLTLTAPAGAT